MTILLRNARLRGALLSGSPPPIHYDYEVTLHGTRVNTWVCFSDGTGRGPVGGGPRGTLSPGTWDGNDITFIGCLDGTPNLLRLCIAGNHAQNAFTTLEVETADHGLQSFDTDDVNGHNYNSVSDSTLWDWDTEAVDATDSMWNDNDLGQTHGMSIT